MSAIQHGVNCEKVLHSGFGYLHAEDDNSPFDSDGVKYCGRCHHVLPAPEPIPTWETQLDRIEKKLDQLLKQTQPEHVKP